MISYQALAAKPTVFKSTMGLTVDEFDRLFQKFFAAWFEQERKRLERPDR